MDFRDPERLRDLLNSAATLPKSGVARAETDARKGAAR